MTDLEKAERKADDGLDALKAYCKELHDAIAAAYKALDDVADYDDPELLTKAQNEAIDALGSYVD